MMKKKIILLIGEGGLPSNIINNLLKKNITFFSLIISDRWDKKIEKYDFKKINLGSIISELNCLKKKGYLDIVFAGSVKRPSISDIKPDFQTIKFIPKFAKVFLKGGDDYLLKFIINELKKLGFSVLGLKKIIPENFLSSGIYSEYKPSKISLLDIEKGKKVLDSLSKFDIGQSIIIQQGNVLGIEAVEGTDNLIKRVHKFIKPGEKPTLIKLIKKRQIKRADLPTIGLKTLKYCKKFSISGIAYSANNTLFINHLEVIRKANEFKIFIYGI